MIYHDEQWAGNDGIPRPFVTQEMMASTDRVFHFWLWRAWSVVALQFLFCIPSKARASFFSVDQEDRAHVKVDDEKSILAYSDYGNNMMGTIRLESSNV